MNRPWERNSQHREPPARPAGAIARVSYTDVLRSVCQRVYFAGFLVEIIHGLTVLVHMRVVPTKMRRQPPAVRCYRGEFLAYADFLVQRDSLPYSALLEGVRFDVSDEFRSAYFVVRAAPIEEAATIAAKMFRSSNGLALRRRQASAVADLLDALRERASQPVRRSR